MKNINKKRAYVKYRNEKTEVDGILFDSKKEAKRYWDLKILERAGKIKDLQRQQWFVLIPSIRLSTGTAQRPTQYQADFVYFDLDKQITIVEDAKGHRTKEYILKKKLMKFIHNIEIVEV